MNQENIRRPLVTIDFEPPLRSEFGDYYAVPISTKEAVEDWQVLTSNAETIVQLRGGGSREDWPFVCSLEENYKDLAWLEVSASYKQLFSYIIRHKNDDRYAGCLYIYPIELFYPYLADKHDVDFSFWITKREYDEGVYDQLYGDLAGWLTEEWGFSSERVYLRNREVPKSYQK